MMFVYVIYHDILWLLWYVFYWRRPSWSKHLTACQLLSCYRYVRVRSSINRCPLIVFYVLRLECLGSIILTGSFRTVAGHVYTSPTIMPLVLIYNPSMQGQADTHTPSPSWWSAWRLYKPSIAGLVQRWRSASPPRTPSGQRYPSQRPWSCRRAPFLIPFYISTPAACNRCGNNATLFWKIMHAYKINIVWLARPSLARLVYATHVPTWG